MISHMWSRGAAPLDGPSNEAPDREGSIMIVTLPSDQQRLQASDAEAPTISTPKSIAARSDCHHQEASRGNGSNVSPRLALPNLVALT